MDETEMKRQREDSSTWRSIREWIQVIVIALVISLPIRFFIAEPFLVHGASMDPTFATGQFLIVDRLSYRFESPKRGDVIVFEYPHNPKVYYIKRIIGLPGEKIAIKNGEVYINGTKDPSQHINEPYVEDSRKSHDTLEVTLGDTEYFVMGDNRIESSDSRSWGPVDKNFIVGRPFIRIFPIDTLSIFPGEYHESKD